MTDKCPCSMTALELLQQNLSAQKPQRMVLIVDHGNGWDVTSYGPQNAGRPRGGDPDCITLQATLELIEETLVRLRREPDDDGVVGEIVTDPAGIVRALSR